MSHIWKLEITFEPGYGPTEQTMSQLAREIKRKLPETDAHLEYSDTVGVERWEIKSDYDE